MKFNNLISKIEENYNNANYEKVLELIFKTMMHFDNDIYYRENIQMVSYFDKICDDIGSKMNITKDALSFDSSMNVYLATELYPTGGHTLCLKNYIDAAPQKKHYILLTHQRKKILPLVKKLRFNSDNVFIIEYPKNDSNLISRVQWIQEQLYKLKPTNCFLFNHPYDVSVVAAAQSNLSRYSYIFLHANVSPNLGLSTPHFRLITIHGYEFLKLSKKVNINRLIYIPLSMKPPKKTPQFKPNIENIIVSASSLSSEFKIKLPYHYSFEEYVAKLLIQTRGVHILFGSFSDQLKENIIEIIKPHGLSSKNLVHLKWVESLGDALQEMNVNLFLSTFPLSGGQTEVEVMSVGIPIIFHSNYSSPNYAMQDLVYPEAYIWRTESDFDTIIKHLSIEDLQKHHQFSLDHFKSHHDQIHLEKHLKKAPIIGKSVNLDDEEKIKNTFFKKNELLSYLDHLEYQRSDLKINN